MIAHPPGWFLDLLVAAFALAFLVGCQSTPKVNWANRVGHYTCDQAVAELGVPDKTATLSDGRPVAEWVAHRSGGSAFSFGVGSFGRHTGVGVSQTVGAGGQAHGLRLTFDANGTLAFWAKY